ncbi:MAG TPA: DUF2059 domain-containing protein [Candidatus Acidoferrum sp.]|jgi:hypothetical protein
MKAVLALIAIYVAAFIIATQGASQNPVQASTPLTDISATSKSIDPVKAGDLRSLLEFVGAKEQLQAEANESAAQYREKLHASVPNASMDSLSEAERQALIATASATFQKNFNQQHAMQQIVDIYDKHYSEDEVRGLLDFFSSPLGQKFAAESPKIAREISAVQGAAVASATRESLQALQAQESVSEKSVVLNSDGKTQREITLQDQMKQVSQRP